MTPPAAIDLRRDNIEYVSVTQQQEQQLQAEGNAVSLMAGWWGIGSPAYM